MKLTQLHRRSVQWQINFVFSGPHKNMLLSFFFQVYRNGLDARGQRLHHRSRQDRFVAKTQILKNIFGIFGRRGGGGQVVRMLAYTPSSV